MCAFKTEIKTKNLFLLNGEQNPDEMTDDQSTFTFCWGKSKYLEQHEL